MTVESSATFSPFLGFFTEDVIECTYTYNATGYEEFYNFTHYTTAVTIFWGIN